MALAAMIVTIGFLAPSAPSGALAYQDDPPSPTTSWDDPYYDDTYVYDDTNNDPAYNDPYYDDTYNSGEDPCDPAFHPDPASDPYCNPSATFNDATDGTYLGPEDDIALYCDPASYPGWASDPMCNPDAGATPTTVATPSRFPATQTSDYSNDTPLTEIDPEEAPRIGAGRMLLAIDAIAELGGFERAIEPERAALLRDIRVDIAAAGLDEDGYTAELERFIADFIPFLEAIEADGVAVSEHLWEAAEGLDAVLFGEVNDTFSAPIEPGLLAPRPWLDGLADLLARGGESAAVPTPETDESDIRELLAAFAFEEDDASTTTAPPQTETSQAEEPPAILALETAQAPEETPSSTLPIVPIALGLAALFLAGVVTFVMRSRSQRRPLAETSVLHPERSTNASEAKALEEDTSRANVTELLDASRRMSASLDASAIASIALAETRRIAGAEGGIVVRRTDDSLDPIGCEPPTLFSYEHLGDSCLSRVIETGQSTAVVFFEEPLLVEVPMAMAAVPIVTEGIVKGAILVVRTSAIPFNPEQLEALDMLAPMVGSALALAERHETATELADVEPLTGLQNRRRLDVDLAAISTDDEVAYVMVDIDHFKNFNDTNGHAAGDEALRQVSALLQASVRPNDLVYRYGGEEFCVLLPATTAAEAAVVAERARAAVEAAVIPGMENQPEGKVTISVGVSDSAFGTPGDLVERADAALYVSKRNGRNQVTLSPTS